jgi:hypothetical protein
MLTSTGRLDTWGLGISRENMRQHRLVDEAARLYSKAFQWLPRARGSPGRQLGPWIRHATAYPHPWGRLLVPPCPQPNGQSRGLQGG